MKKFSVFNQDGEGLFESLPQDISAEVTPVIIGNISAGFYKLTANNGEYNYLVGIFGNEQDAIKNLYSLMKALRKARHGKFKYDGWQPNSGEFTALELLDEFERADRHKENFFDVAAKIFKAADGDEDDE